MPAHIDLTGQKFGRLIVAKRMDNDKHKNSRWLCRCKCGKNKVVLGCNLKNGRTKSCGCLFKEGNNKKHGHSTTIKISKIYRAWDHMVSRCTNPNNIGYHNYGDRGIRVCERWMKFENFLEDMGEPPTQEHSIDRINNDGNYCKENCRWATNKQQSRNTSRNHLITHKEKTQCLIEWAEEFNIHKNTLSYRLRKGWPIEKALITPVIKRRSL